MSNKHIITDFKDLRKAIEEVTKSKPAQTQYEKQAEKMNYMQEAADEKDDKKDSGLLKRKDHAGEEEIKKAYMNLGTAAQGSVEYQRKLIQKELAKMGYKTYSKYAFDSIFKFENNSIRLKEISLDKNMLMRDFPNVWATKDSKLYRILNTFIIRDGFTTLLKSYKKDRKKFVDMLKKIAKSPAAQQRAGMGAKDMQYINKPKKGQSFWSQFDDDVDLDEGKMGQILLDIQQGATAKELAKDYKIPLMVAKNFLKDYYGQKKGSRKEGFASDAQRRAAFASGYKAKGKKGKKESVEEENLEEGTWAVPDSYKKLYNIQVGFLEMKKAATKANAKKMAKDLYNLFGDDELFDDLYRVEKGDDTETKDLRDILKKHLEKWGIKIKPQGSRYQITHAPQKWLDNMTANPADEDVDETAKRRKTGNIKKSGLGARKKFDMKMMSKEEKLKEAKQSPFKLKSQAYPRAIGVDTKGFGKRHATVLDITEACDSFGMITDKELQVEQVQKQLGKQGFISYNNSDLQDVFEDRETQRMIYALESLTEEQEPIEYTKDQVEDAYIMSEEIEFVKPDGQKTAGPVLKVCENTFNIKDKYTGKSFTYKFINEDNKVRTFREITEGRFPAKLIKQAGGIAFDKRYVAGNMTGAVKAIEKLKKGLSDDPKVKELLRIANESFNNNFFKSLAKEDQDAYVKFFQSALKKFNVTSPAQLDKEKKKEFFNYIDKNYKAKDEDMKEHNCATHVEHAVFGSGQTVSGQHTLVQEGEQWVVTHYDVEFEHGLEEMVSVSELAITKQESHAHAMAKKAGRKKMKASWNKKEQRRIDGRRKNFREKMKKLGYIKAR